ncbi:hypothetical protein FA95DRAFT_1684921 [Auriscalpium vulgare]|uniref:Uncharacterized protein n=1 Tax=Auriscalpium vulgare TaxID=40419 RepID=A0ACB8QZP1_9AGAM|nr:hypothetical protein FA95DRAFT_1684921 [Auriscalpium vulgare]
MTPRTVSFKLLPLAPLTSLILQTPCFSWKLLRLRPGLQSSASLAQENLLCRERGKGTQFSRIHNWMKQASEAECTGYSDPRTSQGLALPSYVPLAVSCAHSQV